MSKTSPPGSCPVKLRRVLLVFVAAHLLAVLAEPLVFFSRSDFQTAPEFTHLRRLLSPYAEWMYLDHGYFFFAPNPGPNHLVGARSMTANLEGIDPSQTKMPEVLFPDRRKQWPRLLYHRYFMLSEFYNNSFAPTELHPMDQSDPVFFQRWKEDRAFYESLQQSIQRSLKVSGELVRLERPLPTAQEVLEQGVRLDDSRRLIELSDSPTATGESATGEVGNREAGNREVEPIEAGRIPR
jgi:hypothetical protein